MVESFERLRSSENRSLVFRRPFCCGGLDVMVGYEPNYVY
ncbi:hypothetical protein HMPREF9418_1673 [Neisseria macacae ATCC 33926]|uniref:Uncharacterized protein n=1 Tax=Neisseria macacae ATCC 33926 TaxID=997348 RepID=A0AA36XKJ8_9NEIS|nr:hypothetical protein HMPREF9418_1673 [Neisseria macacae ATCC 33926]